ncbi:hypothetical protein LCGC14_1030540 [marine sediment metagenome]|uniref:Uncharacterized protein n=1 Tax=marine sediment metagenome TaxID=412755 RepID=A0A0F9MUP0_9ZZZZ
MRLPRALILLLLSLTGCSLGPGPQDRAPAATASSDVATVKATGFQTVAETATGINVDSAMPVGLGLLLGFQSWLSHRREIIRIQQNGKST